MAVDPVMATVYTVAPYCDYRLLDLLERLWMELAKLLGTRFDCDCGRTHELPIHEFLYESGAIERLPDVLRCSVPDKPLQRAAVVADVRTWAVCGDRVNDTLRNAGLDVARLIVPDRKQGGPVCDDVTSASVVSQLQAEQPDAVVAVGSGVINDLCKWASFKLGVPYVVVATAASMNGYAAANVAAKIEGVKVLVEARPPVAVVAEPDVIEKAPLEMTTAGFGDTIAKYQSNTDWLMNHLLLDEYYCDFCAGIVAGLEPLYLERPEDIKEGNPRAVGGLFAALFWSGVAMTVVGTSAPASGGEHLLSHTLDMASDVQGRPHDLHGRQVGVGTIFSAALYERLLALENPTPGALPNTVDPDYWRAPALVTAVKQQYEAKRPAVSAVARKMATEHTWDQLRARLLTESTPPAIVRDWLRRAGGATTAEEIACSRNALRDAALHMHEIRKRFTVVDLAWMVGILPGAVDEIIDQWLTG